MTKKPIFKKYKYIKVNYFTESKESFVYYKQPKDDQIKIKDKTFIINPNHIFLSNGFKTVILINTASETVNPLDFKSRFSASIFNSAINNNLIKETFETITPPVLDLTKILLIANLFIGLILVFLMLKNNGVI